jgi:hypothetical protein
MRDGPVEVAPVRLPRRARRVHVGAVDREGGDDVTQRTAEDVAGEVGRARVLSGDARGIAREHVQLARHLVRHDAQLALAHDLGEGRLRADEFGVGAGQAVLTGGIRQQAEEQVRELVARRALDRPVLAQRLVAREDLLDNEVEGARRPLAQPGQVALRVEQPVHMVDADAVQRAVPQKVEHQPVRVVEQLRQLHPDAGKLVDVEEPAVVDVVGRHAKMRHAPVLVGDQGVQPPPVSSRPSTPFSRASASSIAPRTSGLIPDEPRQLRLQLPRAAGDMRARIRQVREGIAQALKLGVPVAQDAACSAAG